MEFYDAPVRLIGGAKHVQVNIQECGTRGYLRCGQRRWDTGKGQVDRTLTPCVVKRQFRFSWDLELMLELVYGWILYRLVWTVAWQR